MESADEKALADYVATLFAGMTKRALLDSEKRIGDSVEASVARHVGTLPKRVVWLETAEEWRAGRMLAFGALGGAVVTFVLKFL